MVYSTFSKTEDYGGYRFECHVIFPLDVLFGRRIDRIFRESFGKEIAVTEFLLLTISDRREIVAVSDRISLSENRGSCLVGS
jgi:hypothetical protein